MNWIKKEQNLLFSVFAISALSYLSAYLKYINSGKIMAMSPIFAGLYFPVTVLIAMLVIRKMGNLEKVAVEHTISIRASWSLIWRAFVAHSGASLIMLFVARTFNFTAEWSYGSQLYFFLGVTWFFAVPLSSWLLFARNKKEHVLMLFGAARGY